MENAMVKRAKPMANQAVDGQFLIKVKESANQIWLAGLGAFAKGQEEGLKFFESLVREGEKVQHNATKAAGARIADVKAQATGTWGKLERVFEERVSKALHGLNVPTKKDIDALSKRVSELTAVTQKLTDKVGTRSAQKANRPTIKEL
jgi:poly(hydroxyalkanoate) granule-associated protein